MTEKNTDTMELLLQETRKSNNRRLAVLIVLSLMLVAMIAAGVILIPRAIETMNNVNTMTTMYGETINKAGLFFDGLSETDIRGMSESVQKVAELIASIGKWIQ